MKAGKFIFGIIIFMTFYSKAQPQRNGFWGGLEPGPFQPGFRLIERQDLSRFYTREIGQSQDVRIVRTYIWYPAAKSGATTLPFKVFLRMAAEDFRLPAEGNPAEWPRVSVPVPLRKGLEEGQFRALFDRPTASVLNADPADGSFPLIVLGQGLYYESPLSQLVLCEYLASRGYVVATCPLLGTHYRLANLNVEDLETQIRDMEFVIGSISECGNVSPDLLGIIGYDLGGMAGVTLTMRNPEVDAFLCLDAGILFEHGSGLPNSHPSYREDRFTVPFMHMTQARFIKFYRDEQKISTLIDRKTFGDSYLVQVPTHNHGAFSSYSMFGIKEAVPGYWGSIEKDLDLSYQTMCLLALDFFDGYLKQAQKAISNLHKAAQRQDSAASSFIVEFKKGTAAPKSEAHLVHLLIEKGPKEALPQIEKARASFPDIKLLGQDVLNWLGYHFLLWWGREEDAVEVFKLNVSLYPQSANAYDSLGEAYMVRGETENAMASYERSLELDPENKNAAEKLKQLKQGSGVIAVSVTPADGNNEIYVINADGGGLQQLTDHQGRDCGPAWSPDAKKIAFYVHDDEARTWSIFVMDADGGNIRRLTDKIGVRDHSPSWSPDGNHIAFARGTSGSSEIWRMNADGSDLMKCDSVVGGGPKWSPDGTQIAFHSNSDGNSEIYVMSADGASQKRLTYNNADDWWPSWSPDGRQIVFQSDRDGNYEIYRMNSDGTNQVRLTDSPAEDAEPAWSPDGTRIAFSSFRDGKFEIYVMNADGSSPTRLTRVAGQAIQPSWRPLGRNSGAILK